MSAEAPAAEAPSTPSRGQGIAGGRDRVIGPRHAVLSALFPTPAAEHPTVAGVAELAVSAVAEHTDATGAAQFEKDFGGTAQHGPVGDDHDRLGGRGFDDVGDRGGDSMPRL